MPKTFEELIKDYISQRGWSIRDLAAEAGMPPSTLSSLLRGDSRTPDLRTLAALSRATAIPLRVLIEAYGFSLEHEAEYRSQVERIAAAAAKQPKLAPIIELLADLTVDELEGVHVYLDAVMRRRQQKERS